MLLDWSYQPTRQQNSPICYGCNMLIGGISAARLSAPQDAIIRGVGALLLEQNDKWRTSVPAT
jgi:hypothetical protein